MRSGNVAPIALLMGALALATTLSPAAATAASCCGGASTSSRFSLPKFRAGLAGLSLEISGDFDQRLDGGGRMGLERWRNQELRSVFGGALRLHRDVQTSISVPVVGRSARSGSLSGRGLGLGDPSLGARWEILDDEICYARPFSEMAWDQIKPSLHWTWSATLPLGRHAGQAAEPLSADATGRGYWLAETGLELVKNWGAVGTAAGLAAGYQHPVADLEASPGIRWSVGGTLMYYPAYQRYVGVDVTHRREVWLAAGAGALSSTSLAAVGSWVFGDSGWWLRGSAGSDGLLQGAAVPVGWRTTVTVLRLF